MTFSFAQLVAHAAKTRELAAGSIIGSGTVSNKQGGLHGSSIANGGVGYCCLAEVRMYETIEQGAPQTPFLRFGDTCASRCWTRPARASSARSTRRSPLSGGREERMKLYTYFRSSAAYRVRIALNLKGLQYEAVPVHLLRGGGEQLQEQYRAINPSGLVPAFQDDYITLTQSMAILEYLDDEHPACADDAARTRRAAPACASWRRSSPATSIR
jgi:hypothetical protein